MKNKGLELGIAAASIAGAAVLVGLPSLRAAAGGAMTPVLPETLIALLLIGAIILIVRRQAHFVARLDEQMDELRRAYGIGSAAAGDRGAFHVLHRINTFFPLASARLRELDQEALQAQAATRLVRYQYEKTQAVLEAMPEAVVVLDQSCVPTFATPRAEHLLGVSRAALVGNPPQKWCTDKEVLGLIMACTRELESGAHTASLEYSPAGHPERRIAVSAHPLFMPHDRTSLFGTLVVFRDVTHEHLAKQAGADFVAHVSHELKTPLATLAAYSELLMDFQSLADAERVNALNVVRDEVERIAALIGNLLNISKLETGNLRVSRQRVKMHDLLRDSVENLGRNAARRGVSLELKIPPDLGSVRLDKDLFRIAIDNLLSNAIKYSNESGRVTVGAEYVEDERMRVSVKDDGIGIAPEDRARVFEKYFRSASHEVAARSGHGLGLYLVRQIVELHHGTVGVESEPGKGSTFSIEFDARHAPLEEVQQP